MQSADALVQELDLEAAFTRKVLERVPFDKADWKPHEKSMPLGVLATFSAMIFTWGIDIMDKDTFDVASVGTERPQPAKSRDELLALFDRHVSAARAAIAKSSDEHLARPWTLLASGQQVFTQPRWLVLRTYLFNHAVHHRGQLTVYLRLLGIPVPAIYNESADEKGGMFMEKQSVTR